VDKEEKTLRSEYKYRGKVVTLRVDQVLLPNGREGSREVIEHSGAVAVVPLTGDGRILLVRQYRKAVERELIEIPAGRLDPGEDPRDCASRELREETGFDAGRLEHIITFCTTPGFSDEMIHLFIARDLYPSALDCDEDEFISLLQVTPREAAAMITDGRIIDGKTICGIYALLFQEQKL